MEQNANSDVYAAIKRQGDIVRELKAKKSNQSEITEAVKRLQILKLSLLKEQTPAPKMEHDLPDRKTIEDLLRRRFFFDQSFSLYGGVNGLYDFGPMGCAMKINLLAEWRRQFVLEEQMLEIDTSVLTPEIVLKTSGHVERFCDLMVRDTVTGECYRADHLLEGFFDTMICDPKCSSDTKNEIQSIRLKLESMNENEIKDVIRRFNVTSPVNKNPLSDPIPFNLMFSTHLGATGVQKCFLRPETAQGIFVNFKRLLEFNQGRLPFAVAQIGSSFRNEIAPRSGLLRVREFTMAEIEHFHDPEDKGHPRFEEVRLLTLTLFSSNLQLSNSEPCKMSVGDAVENGVIHNETLAYFLAKIYLFLTSIGIDSNKLRFRQHLPNEMAHYASDCWDAECLTTYGWIECVGCADRSCFDLCQHSNATGIRLGAERILNKEKTVLKYVLKANRKEIGQRFKEEAPKLLYTIEKMNDIEKKSIYDQINDGAPQVSITSQCGAYTWTLDAAMLSVKKEEKQIKREEFIPAVIEPSFGVGRVLYAVWEHCFRFREEDTQRNYLALPARISPYKCAVLPLTNDSRVFDVCHKVSDVLRKSSISHKVEKSTSVSIGKRYARTDEIGVPFSVTVDFDSVNKSPSTVTLRERDSMKQIRLEVTDVSKVVNDLCDEKTSWDEVTRIYGEFTGQETTQ